ncbi:hypothetical protein [Actinokineospora globicatena]|uniref:Uncharacterized protein n=1 Tax=Actinokineospora globicatena TaxID=103729 RepID=A0A9W6VDQ2_9PSEU|nr:hypothetical protein [Actinokineospora globicatena]GLW95526.1 hypothetical protein Aglo03_63420 [Actinokineospora globicatena]
MAQQMSFFSAEARHPAVADLAGLLCGPGQAVLFARATARLVVPVDTPWRMKALVRACAERGIRAEVDTGDDGARCLRTAFRVDLAPLAAAWGGGAGKAVPAGFVPDGAALRMWVATVGHWSDAAYLLPLDPAAPGTHEPLLFALAQCGLPATMHQTDDGGPALRLIGRRRLGRLRELVGAPAATGCAEQWPAVSRMRAVS